ncbi:hypothetical protein [Nonomuraea endophytica]|uniref:hypothetical protein n=1 Tax=Nonomuraea endophytica TaxID=714136 RepID=UPI0037C6E3D9
MAVEIVIAIVMVVIGILTNLFSGALSEHAPILNRLTKRHVIFMGVGLIALATVPSLLSLLKPATQSSPPAAADKGNPQVLLVKDAFDLGPPSTYLGPETDKIDLDTGERGYGKISQDTGIDLQPDAGGRTDLVIEESEVHTFADSDRNLAPLTKGEQGDYGACAGALADDSRRAARISLRELREGARLCVRTDEKRVALVTVKSVSQGPALTIGYVTWEIR